MVLTKTDNHDTRAKLALRRHFLRQLKSPPSVLDCFSGYEVLWSKLRDEFELRDYLALDLKSKHGRLAMDSLRYLQNQKWTHDVIDLDAYGSPWRHFFEVCKRGLVCTVFLTIGNSQFKDQSPNILKFLGINFPVPNAIRGRLSEMVFEHCIAAPLAHGLTISECLEADNPGGSARYIGMKIARKSENSPH